jgi:hypothetical protein
MPFRLFLLSTAALTLLTMLTSSPARARAKDTITWMEAVMPPFLIKSGVHQNQGYGSVITGIIQQGLTDYAHDTMTTNITRHF